VLLAAAKLAPNTSEVAAIAAAMTVLRDTLFSFSSMTPAVMAQASKSHDSRWAETWWPDGDDLVNDPGIRPRRS
jgi:hypothetical protein